MIEIAESISSFSPQASPSDQFITLTYGQLKDLIIQAVAEAMAPLEARIEALEARQDERLAALEMDQTNTTSNIEILFNLSKTIKDQIQPEPQPTQRDRGDILRALLAANDGKMLLKTARQKMHLSKSRFSELLTTMGDYIETKPFSRDHRQKVLVLK